jgi:hypothetical protein
MFIITNCPECDEDFMYHISEKESLTKYSDDNKKLEEEYPVHDIVWPSRRWNNNMTEHIDLNGGIIVCQECIKKINMVQLSPDE